jgi:murein L,D-transpeptidase YcbB/YkuD
MEECHVEKFLQFTQINDSMTHSSISQIIVGVIVVLQFISCNDKSEKTKAKNIPPLEMDVFVQEIIKNKLEEASAANKLDDSTGLYAMQVLNYYYEENDYSPIWSSKGKWQLSADSLMGYLQQCETDGLFKDDYQFAELQTLKKLLDDDSLNRKDAEQWARVDILFTDAFVHLLQDLKQGRLQPDSLCWINNKTQQETFFKDYLDKIKTGQSLYGIVQSLQPTHTAYLALKKGAAAFLQGMDKNKYTYLSYPSNDSIGFLKTLVTRLNESGMEAGTISEMDTTKLRWLISTYQQTKGLKPTGKLSASLVNFLNNTDQEKFKRIAITLDRYKQLPEQMPEKYIWVNLPSYYLRVWERDTLQMESKIIIGKPNTPTPDIYSEISDLVIYPTWTVPNSIILKEILPALKRNPDYLTKKGLGLYDNNGDTVNPRSVNWTKYSKGIPYFVRQNSGDNNALGVIKFNFNNPFDVYLHDTNQRYLFKNQSRSLSHGCVRVQDWKKLAFYIVRNDSIQSALPDSLKLRTDSIMSWLAQKEKHRVFIKQRIPVFIRYFGCEAVNGSILFYEDIYNRDKVLREKYFALK